MPSTSATRRLIDLSVVGASIVTQSPSSRPYSRAVSGLISSTGQGRRLRSFGTSIPSVE